MSKIYRLFSSTIHYYGITTKDLNDEFKDLMYSYVLYSSGIPRMIDGVPHREDWSAAFSVLKLYGKQLVLIEQIETYPDAKIAEGMLRYHVQKSDCCNVIYKRWPHTNGLNSDLFNRQDVADVI